VTEDAIVVGAPASIVRSLEGAGAVYVFDHAGGLVRTLQDPTPAANAFFGTSVAVIGDALVVGVPGATSVGVAGGVVKVFDAATGAFRRTLTPPISRDAAAFGTVVGQLGGQLFVSAPGDRAFGSDAAGAVYLFGAGATRLDRVLTPPATQPGMNFGHAVLAVGDDLLIGADGANDGSGAAFLIEPLSSVLAARFLPTLARTGGRFGFALATTAPVIAIGEPATGDASAVGRVYLFGPSTGSPPSVLGPPEPTAGTPSAGAAAVARSGRRPRRSTAASRCSAARSATRGCLASPRRSGGQDATCAAPTGRADRDACGSWRVPHAACRRSRVVWSREAATPWPRTRVPRSSPRRVRCGATC
jgi:hypothetical protein